MEPWQVLLVPVTVALIIAGFGVWAIFAEKRELERRSAKPEKPVH